MISILLIIIPFFIGLACIFIKRQSISRSLIIIASGLHLLLTTLAGIIQTNNIEIIQPYISHVWFNKLITFKTPWLAIDSLNILFLFVTSLLFLGASFYCVQYLADEKNNNSKNIQSNNIQSNNIEQNSFYTNESIFSGCFLIFLSTMTFAITSQHLALLWVAIEATTLASAPLIYFHKSKQSMEATWKYLLICSVGIAIALLGTFFLNLAVSHSKELFIIDILKNPEYINTPWLKGAFLLLFVGYGTKMGIAPFHTWLPDAHSEAPSVVSALLSGALLNCAFLGILRIYQICIATGLKVFCQEIFILFGIISIVTAAVFVLNQKNFKRMLAYSSIEHMGIIILGLGLGKYAVTGALINLIGHSFTKAGLFFIAGNILSYFKTCEISGVKGIISSKIRYSGILWMLGFLLITGTPPSGVFLGKFIILKEALFTQHYFVTIMFLAALAIIFIGMSKSFIFMSYGSFENSEIIEKKKSSSSSSSSLRVLPSAIFFIFVVSMGLYFPDWLSLAIQSAALKLGGL